MSRFAFGAALLSLAVLASCGRGSPRPNTAAGPKARPDTTARPQAISDSAAQRMLAERRRERERLVPNDSVKADAALADSMRADSARADSAARKEGAAKKKEPTNERCVLDLLNTPETRTQLVRDPATQKYFTYIGGGVHGKCRRQDITIISDSAESYDQTQLYILINNVRYRETRVTLDAQRATYYRAEERLVLDGNVRAVMSNGATMRGSHAEYYRAVRGIRQRARLVATNRPVLTYVEKDSTGKPQPPVELVADQITSEGDSTYIAQGKVVLTREDVIATGDSAFLDNSTQLSRLMKGPLIESKGNEKFTLKGRVIDLFGSSRQVDRILALDSARATSKDLILVSDTIDLRVRDRKLQRSFAWGPGGARATTPERDITADSLHVVMPNQRIQDLFAVRRAYAESDPDTNKVVSDERDWLRGDTIIAHFDSLPPNDTTSKPQAREIRSLGAASSYYQIPNDKVKDKPGINYVRGDSILVDFAKGDVETVTVFGEVATGLYLEADTDTTADSTRARVGGRQQGRRAGQTRGRQPSGRRPTPIRRPDGPADGAADGPGAP